MAKQSSASASGSWEREHRYGPAVHVLDNLYLLTSLARLSGNEVQQPELTSTLRRIYRTMMALVAGRELPRRHVEMPTRMAAQHPEAGIWRGEVLDPATRVVIVDIVRAGIVPSQVCFEMLSAVLPSDNVRLDHLFLSRRADEAGHVTGVDLAGAKIGGSVAGAILLLPDPMGATGSTTLRAVRHYREHFGQPARIIAMPMIATPEYLRTVTRELEAVVVYTARLDRGLSPPDVLECIPGERWDEERGLDEKSYIVPGAGGMGEVLNNSWC